MENRKKKHHLQYRLNSLFFAIFLLFFVLIFRLGVVQVVEGETYATGLTQTNSMKTYIDAPRGIMYDRYHHIVVDNELDLSIIYNNVTPQNRDSLLDIAEKIAMLIEIDDKKVTPRDKKDYLLSKMDQQERYELVSKQEREHLTSSEIYKRELDEISDRHIANLTKKDLQIIAVFREMMRGDARIKRGVSDQEAHLVSEYLDQLPGVDLLRDSHRSYPYGQSFQSFFGSIGAIPKEKVSYYLSRGYERTDYVGTSFLEQQYENVLRGEKAELETIGQRGHDLILTIDMEFQQQLENLIVAEIERAGQSFINNRSAYAVVIEPKTGDVLAMAGFNDFSNGKGNLQEDHIGTVLKAFEMGSSIKAASVLTGFEAGVTKPGQVFKDRPIKLPNTPIKRSWNTKGFGYVSDRQALEVSSNVYMFEIGMRMAHCHYTDAAQDCEWNRKTINEAYDQVRYSFSQFGLGSNTGIDLPMTSSGLNGGNQAGGHLLDLMIGQFDTYTPLQLAQYIATVANNGYRMKPRLVSEIREAVISSDQPGTLLEEIEPVVLNRVDMLDAHLKQVQAGLRDVMVGGHGTAKDVFSSKPYQPAGKTGTAEVRVRVGEGANSHIVSGHTQTLVAYAPHDQPEVAIAVVVPHVKVKEDGGRQKMAQRIAARALDTFFDMKQKRNGPTRVEGNSS